MSVTEETIVLNVDLMPADKPSIAKMLLNLRDLPYFSDVSTTGFQEGIDEESGAITGNYTITMTYGENPKFAAAAEDAAAQEAPAEEAAPAE